jgi:hypothetical protein
MDQIKIKVSKYLVVSMGARIALDIAPANAPPHHSFVRTFPKGRGEATNPSSHMAMMSSLLSNSFP